MRRGLALAAAVVFGAVSLGCPAGAVESPLGSKNFHAPGYVPNYFSNESGPFQGDAPARSVQPGGTGFAASLPRPRAVAATGRHGRRAMHARAGVRGRARAAARHQVLHGRAARSKAVIARSRAKAPATRVAGAARSAPRHAARIARR